MLRETMDISVIWELFTNIIEASAIVGDDLDFIRRVKEARSLIFPLQIGNKGQLQEWIEDYEDHDPHHRHVSHLQSHDQAITLLPALPDAWDKGSVKGLRARGGFELGIHWIGRSLQKATVISLRGEPCTLRTTVPIKVKGVSVVSQPELTDFGKWYITTFPTTQGRIYEIQPAISVK